jgi:hypothetical protein
VKSRPRLSPNGPRPLGQLLGPLLEKWRRSPGPRTLPRLTGRTLPPLALPLVAAVLAHGLWISYAQLRRSRQPPPAALSARDNTPELLRFSRRMPLEQSLGTVPLPPASTLPPPPPDLLMPLPGPGGGSRSVGAPAATRQRTTIAMAATPRQATARQATAGQAPAHRTATSRRPGLGPTDPSPPTLSAPGAAALNAPAGEDTAEKGSGPAPEGPLATLRTVRRLAAGPAIDGRAAADTREAGAIPLDGAPLLLRPEGSAGQAYEKLWTGAQPATAPPTEMGDLPEGVELRRLPLAQARSRGVLPVHRQGVLLGGHVLLFWVDGPTLWLLRAPLA